MKKIFLSAKELAERWNISIKTLRQWRWQKKGPKFIKIGGRAAYRLEDIEKFEDAWEDQKIFNIK